MAHYEETEIGRILVQDKYGADSTYSIAPYLEVNETGICKVIGENIDGSVKDVQVIIPKDIFIEAFNKWCK